MHHLHTSLYYLREAQQKIFRSKNEVKLPHPHSIWKPCQSVCNLLYFESSDYLLSYPIDGNAVHGPQSPLCSSRLDIFTPAAFEQLHKLVTASPFRGCELDVEPTWIMNKAFMCSNVDQHCELVQVICGLHHTIVWLHHTIVWRRRTSCIRTHFGFPTPLGKGTLGWVCWSYAVCTMQPRARVYLCVHSLHPLALHPCNRLSLADCMVETGGMITGLANQRQGGDQVSPAADRLSTGLWRVQRCFVGRGTFVLR